MSSKHTDTGGLEAEAIQKIEFVVVKPNGTTIRQSADCGVKTLIAGLKEDMSHYFKDSHPESQTWNYKGRQLDENKTLLYYGIKGDVNADSVIINVKVGQQ